MTDRGNCFVLGLIAVLAALTALQRSRIEARLSAEGPARRGRRRRDPRPRPARAGRRARRGSARPRRLRQCVRHVRCARRDGSRSRGFRVLSVDRPGHGWSERVGGRAASSPGHQADMLRARGAKLGVAEAVVAAHSLGAITGLAMALDAPGFVRAPGADRPGQPSLARRRRLVLHGFGAHPAVWAAVPPAPHAAARHGAHARAAWRAFSRRIRRRRVSSRRRGSPLVLRPLHFRANCEDVAYAEAAVAALSPRYGAIRAPTEIVTGDFDGVVYAHIHSRAWRATSPARG